MKQQIQGVYFEKQMKIRIIIFFWETAWTYPSPKPTFTFVLLTLGQNVGLGKG